MAHGTDGMGGGVGASAAGFGGIGGPGLGSTLSSANMAQAFADAANKGVDAFLGRPDPTQSVLNNVMMAQQAPFDARNLARAQGRALAAQMQRQMANRAAINAMPARNALGFNAGLMGNISTGRFSDIDTQAMSPSQMSALSAAHQSRTPTSYTGMFSRMMGMDDEPAPGDELSDTRSMNPDSTMGGYKTGAQMLGKFATQKMMDDPLAVANVIGIPATKAALPTMAGVFGSLASPATLLGMFPGIVANASYKTPEQQAQTLADISIGGTGGGDVPLGLMADSTPVGTQTAPSPPVDNRTQYQPPSWNFYNPGLLSFNNLFAPRAPWESPYMTRRS